jgi:prepilin signal peptidase PulO-like enzyme (type II secretory pathway)
MTAHAALMTLFAAVLVVLAVIDYRTRRLPNIIVLPAAAFMLVAQVVLDPGRALEYTAAAVGASLFLLVPALLKPEGLGMGDVKLALLLGAALGRSVVAALLIGLVAAGLVGAAILARNGWGARKMTIPLGPFLALGGLAALVL